MITLLKSLLYAFILLGIFILGLFMYEALEFYIIKTTTQENSRQNERSLFLFCLENQCNITGFQVDQIQRLTKERQEILDRALDLQVENLELRKTIERSTEIIDHLIEQLEAYERHYPCRPKKEDRTA